MSTLSECIREVCGWSWHNWAYAQEQTEYGFCIYKVFPEDDESWEIQVANSSFCGWFQTWNQFCEVWLEDYDCNEDGDNPWWVDNNGSIHPKPPFSVKHFFNS